MESRKRVDPPSCIHGSDEGTEIVLMDKSLKKTESSTPLLSSFSGGETYTVNNISHAMFGANPKFGASSSITRKFSFSTNNNNFNNAASCSGSIFKFKTLPETSVCNFTFGTGTVTNKRCNCCKKRIGLTGFACKCGHLFCGNHRYPEEHKCTFDYKAFGREVLRKQNPGLQGDKLHNKI
ncbi:putative zinc finger A20 and AN1 domain-containing stress-associated protein 8 [Mercurialis annua]|uniref:putative zinc finger A20 and AN1 domain-containing stress-associated protein 8 n=1 Tax=Mercurialis annua TaxID=3986 RepID=UPI002160C747|nr:putative zinc finger A20 and AN1 domain-containing stress-associated protein 8 [Mercurialis annua]